MKNKILTSIIAVSILAGLFSCELDQDKAMIKDNVQSNELKEMSSSSFVLSFEEGDNNFETFNWTTVDFGFDASVNYTLELDLEGSDFSNAVELAAVDNDLSATLTNKQINNALLSLGLNPEEEASVVFRVMASISDQVDPVKSTILNLNITPYATTFPPIYIIGDAQSWDLGAAAELEATGPGTYEGTADFVSDGIFRFFAEASWDAEQWGASYFSGGTLPPELVDNGDNDSNFKFTGSDGLYHVTVDLNTKTITLEEQNFPTELYIIGDDQEWNLDAALQLTHLGGGVFEGIGQFGNGNIWRFFEAPDWGAKQWNYATFVDGTIDSKLSGTTEGDANFTFEGETGIYKITVSTVDLTIEMEQVSEPTLYIIGDDQEWNLDNAFKLTWLGGKKFEGTTDFTNGSIFRFFDEPDWAAVQYNYNTFVDGTIDETNLSGTTEGDANFTFEGTTGTYTIKVDLLNLTIEMSQ